MDTTVTRAPQVPIVEASRPVGAAIAAALLGVVALAGLVFGPYLIVLGVAIADDVSGDERTLVLALKAMLGIGCLVLSVVSAVTARGLVRTARWAWPTALFVALVLVVAAVVLFVEGPWLTSYSLLGALGLALALALLPASVRGAFGM